MSIEVTYHGLRPFDKADPSDVLQSQVDGAEGNKFDVLGAGRSEPLKYTGLYRIFAVTESRVRAGPSNLPNASTGCRISEGSVETWWLIAGQVIVCDEVV